MEPETVAPKKKRTIRKILLWIIGIIILFAGISSIYLYSNFNKLVSDALLKSFNSGSVSDVYELKFEKLSVNILLGNIQVHNVELKPREKPLDSYPYINSTLHLRTRKIISFGC